MASQRIGIMDIRQLLQLKSSSLSNRKSASIIGIHRNSVNPYVRLFDASGKSYQDFFVPHLILHKQNQSYAVQS